MLSVQTGEIGLGENHYHQRITVTGGPSQGKLWAAYLSLERRSYAVPVTATAAQIQAMLRTLPYLSSVTVTGAYPVWDVHAGPNESIIEPITIFGEFSDGTNPEVVVTIVKSQPLLYRLHPANSLSEVSVAPTVGRIDVGNVPERRTQLKASEWHWGKDISGGLGKYEFDESEGVDRIWDSNCATDSPEAITVARLEQTMPMNPNVLNAESLIAVGLGRTNAGTRLVALFDMSENNLLARPAFFHTGTMEWAAWPSSSALNSSICQTTFVFYRGYVHVGWSQNNSHGYLTWDGNYLNNCVQHALSTTNIDKTVVSWAEFDRKLFALQRDGTILMTATANPGPNDWEVATTYQGPGYAYALVVYTHGQDEALHLMASDGIYIYILDSNTLKRRLAFHGRMLANADVRPLPHSVTTWRNDLYFILRGREIFRYDGTNLQNISPWAEDGLPENSIAFSREIEPHSLTSLGYWLLANCNAPTWHDQAMTVSSPVTISTPTNWFPTVTVNDTVTINDTLIIDDVILNAHCVLAYNGSGWHALVPLGVSPKQGCQASIVHDLVERSRLEFAPGRYIQFRDDNSRHYRLAKQRYSVGISTVVTPWYDRGMIDIDKLAVYWRIGYRNCGNGRTITPYFQIDGVEDTASGAVGSNPRQTWVRAYRKDGTTTAIGAAANDPPSGVAVRYFVNEGSFPTDGLAFRKMRLRFDLQTNDPTESPILEWCSVVHGAMFDELFVYPVTLSLTGTSPDGRTAERQRRDLLQIHRSKLLHPFYFSENDAVMVKTENMIFRREATGMVADAHESLIASFQVAMFVGAL